MDFYFVLLISGCITNGLLLTTFITTPNGMPAVGTNLTLEDAILTKTTFTFNELKRTNHREIKQLQDQKFRAFIRYQIWPNHPYYRRLFKDNNVDPFNITCIEDWAKYNIPLVRKVDYKDHLREFALNPQEVEGRERDPAEIITNLMNYSKESGNSQQYSFLRNNGARVKLKIGAASAMERLRERLTYNYAPLQFWLSSGRASGLPSPVFLTRYDNDLLANNSVKCGQLAIDPFVESGWELSSMNLFPYAPHLGWHAVNVGLKQLSKFYTATSAGGAIPSDKLVELAKAFKANGFAGMPSYLRNRFFRAMADADYEAPEKVVVLLAGEKIYPRVADDIVQTLTDKGAKEVRVVGGYASSESKVSFAVQCEYNGPYHNLSPLMMSWEFVKLNDDGTYEFVGEDEPGHTVLFHLDSTGTVFEGFLLGDVASKHERGKCPCCGLDGPFFWDIGRTNDAQAQLEVMGLAEKKIKGAAVNLTALRTDILALSGVEEAQIEVAKEDMNDPYSMDVLNLYVAPADTSRPNHDALILEIQKLTKNSTEITPSVFIYTFEEILEKAGGLKFMEISDVRPKPA
jgi:phenylacetate-coenzyme A ligase PaaK-like adenylate-forming protein